SIAQRCPSTEIEVTNALLGLAEDAESPLQRHVGYYLVDDGREVLQRAVEYRPAPLVSLESFVLRRPVEVFFTALCLLTVWIPVALVLHIVRGGGALSSAM